MVEYTQQEIQELYDSCISMEEQERRDDEAFEEFAEYMDYDDEYLYDEEEWCYED